MTEEESMITETAMTEDEDKISEAVAIRAEALSREGMATRTEVATRGVQDKEGGQGGVVQGNGSSSNIMATHQPQTLAHLLYHFRIDTVFCQTAVQTCRSLQFRSILGRMW